MSSPHGGRYGVRLRPLLLLSCVPLAVMGLAACSGPPTASSSSTSQAGGLIPLDGRTPSELEARILADGQITESELLEAQQSFIECMESQGSGFTVTFDDRGAFQIDDLQKFTAKFPDQATADKELERVQEECSVESLDINTAYWEKKKKKNPDGKSFPELVFECFDRMGVEHDGMTADELWRNLDQDPNATWSTGETMTGCIEDPSYYGKP